MFVAYMIPHIIDVQLEDGLQWMAKGETKQEAEAALRAVFEAEMRSEFYTEEELEKVWNDHAVYTMKL